MHLLDELHGLDSVRRVVLLERVAGEREDPLGQGGVIVESGVGGRVWERLGGMASVEG